MPWHAGAWLSLASVFIPAASVLSGAVDPIAQLASIPQPEVWRMQRVIAEHAHCAHYRRAIADGGDGRDPGAAMGILNGSSTLGGEADAFEITLEAVLAVAKGRRVDSLCRRVPWPHASSRSNGDRPLAR